MMEPVVYVRERLVDDAEIEAAKRVFPVVTQRGDVPDNALVIPRLSLLPYPREVHHDLERRGCELANTLRQHQWIASFDWYTALRDHTPTTWTEDEFPRAEQEGPFVVKGATNSMKFRWDTHMFAATKRDAIEVGMRLRDDSLVGAQDLKYREYVPLRVHEESLVGPPFAYEFRFFYWGLSCIGAGYYWSSAEDVDVPVPDGAWMKAQVCACIAAEHCRFFVLDIAETAVGDWILVEVNDGQQSGLSEIDAVKLYRALHDTITTGESSDARSVPG